jgi:uncharacterized protein (DUF433 family)
MKPAPAQIPNASRQSTDTVTADHPADRMRIMSTSGTCGRRPRIDGHRIRVEDVANWHERMRMSPDQIVSEYPLITLADVHAALAYKDQNRERIDSDIEAGKKFAEELEATASPHRLQEKLRRGEADATGDSLPPG